MGVNICVRLKRTLVMLEVIVRSLWHVQLMPASMAMLLASLITGIYPLNLQLLYMLVDNRIWEIMVNKLKSYGWQAIVVRHPHANLRGLVVGPKVRNNLVQSTPGLVI